MKKKLLITMMVATLTATTAFAGDFSFKFGSMAQHPDYLLGVIPTYLNVGVGYDGITLIDGNTTEFEYYVGSGFTQRSLYQDTTTGEQLAAGSDGTVANIFSADGTIKMVQGFLEDDSLTATLGAKEGYDRVYSDDVLAGSTVYPDLAQQNNYYTLLTADLKYDKMEDNFFTQDGYSAELSFAYAPGLVSNSSDFYSANLDLQYAKTLFTLEGTRDGRNLLSVVFIDRFETSYTDGDEVATSYQSNVALGNRVRGFSTYSYNTNLNFVNNIDIRVATFEMTEYPLFVYLPRFNFFFDTGYAMGDYLNSSVAIDSSDALLMSSGVQATLSISDVIDLGYQIAYLIKGDNISENSNIVGSVTFFLQY
jgi:hypothetical protein